MDEKENGTRSSQTCRFVDVMDRAGHISAGRRTWDGLQRDEIETEKAKTRITGKTRRSITASPFVRKLLQSPEAKRKASAGKDASSAPRTETHHRGHGGQSVLTVGALASQ